MGDIIKAYQFNENSAVSVLKPIVFCNCPKEIEEKAFSINVALAKELQKQSSFMTRTMRLEKCLQDVIDSLGDKPVIKDFDVLFNPSYQTDIIKALINVCRKKQFSAIWPGRYEDGRLYYAEEEYEDYKVYEISNYDITVII